MQNRAEAPGHGPIVQPSALRDIFDPPFYYQLWNHLIFKRRIRLGVVVSAVVLASSIPLNRLVGVDQYLAFSDAYALLRGFIIAFGLWGLQYTCAATVSLAGHTYPTLSEIEQSHLARRLRLLYGNSFLIIAGGTFAILMLYQWSHLGVSMPPAAQLYANGSAILTGFIAGIGLYTALLSLTLAPKLLSGRTDHYFPLAPVRSASVRAASQLFLRYSTAFAFEVLPFAIGYGLFLTAAPEMTQKKVLVLDLLALRNSTAIVACLFVVFMPAYFFLPQMIIARHVEGIKLSLMGQFQERIQELARIAPKEFDAQLAQHFQVLREAEQQLAASGTFPLELRDIVKPLIPFVSGVASLFGGEIGNALLRVWGSMTHSLSS